jgi:predicted MFS family arabinose efflux permease
MSTQRTESTPSSGQPPATYYRYGLFVLFLVCVVSYFDRQIVTILAEPIKQELHISDTQLGLLTGFAFGIVYCTFGIPVARLADRFSRIGVLSASLAFWSVCTILCGRAGNFYMLVASRMGVGIGESGSIPTGLALAADYAPRHKRASALAFFAMGTPVGSLLGLALGGIIAGAYGWRTAFLLAGLPGLLLAVLVPTTLRNSARSRLTAEKPVPAAPATETSHITFRGVLRYVMPKKTFWLVAFGAAIKGFISFGQQPFIAAFFLRAHTAEIAHLGAQFGLKPIGVVGISLGLLGGVFGTLSNWLGGVLADRYAVRDLRAFGTIPACAALATIPFACAAVLVHSAVAAFLLLIPGYLLGGLWFGPGLACVQGVVPREMRATASSIALFVINIIGFGFGALAVGALSDLFQHGLGLSSAEGVRWALVVSSFAGMIAAALFWRARRYIREEVVN